MGEDPERRQMVADILGASTPEQRLRIEDTVDAWLRNYPEDDDIRAWFTSGPDDEAVKAWCVIERLRR